MEYKIHDNDSIFDAIPLKLLHHAQSVHLEIGEGLMIKVKDKVRPDDNDEQYVHIVIPRSRLSALKEV